MKVQRIQLHKTVHTLGIIAIMLSAFVACDNINTDGREGKGRMNLYLTDAPGDFEEVNVDVQGVRIRYLATGDTTQTDTTGSDEESKWVDLPVDPFRINLLDLTDADTLIAGAEDLKPGRYSELRLILGEDNDVVIDGESHDLTTPSAQQSGYKIKFNTRLESGEELDLSIDFDAEQSIVVAGKSGKYILKPVLKAFEGRVDPDDD